MGVVPNTCPFDKRLMSASRLVPLPQTAPGTAGVYGLCFGPYMSFHETSHSQCPLAACQGASYVTPLPSGNMTTVDVAIAQERRALRYSAFIDIDILPHL